MQHGLRALPPFFPFPPPPIQHGDDRAMREEKGWPGIEETTASMDCMRCVMQRSVLLSSACCHVTTCCPSLLSHPGRVSEPPPWTSAGTHKKEMHAGRTHDPAPDVRRRVDGWLVK